MAYKSNKTEHSGSKKGQGAYWGKKKFAKSESNKKRRIINKIKTNAQTSDLPKDEGLKTFLKFIEQEIETFTSQSDLIYRVKILHSEYSKKENIALEIAKENGQILIITVGAPKSLLIYFPADYQNNGIGSMHSQNNNILNKQELYTYYIFGHHTETESQNLINIELAFKTLENFIQSDDLPKTISWKED